jgi:hypothetical protein
MAVSTKAEIEALVDTIASLDQIVAWQVIDIQGTGTKEA